MEQKLSIGILGYGEVGKAVASFYEKPYIHDINGPSFPENVHFDILHVCIPFTDPTNFQATVKFAIMKWCEGGLVIIHSTVPVGTTEEIQHHHIMTVHSPVRGVHPNLAEGLRTFPKYIGADDAIAGATAAAHYDKIGIVPFVVHGSRTSELAKLLDTTYYGLAIAFHAYAARLSREQRVNFDMVMTQWNQTYNAGYVELGKGNVVRPVLFAPPDGRIGGHCVIPNAQLLEQQFGPDAILDSILRHK